MPGILATYLSQNLSGIYGAEDFYIYENGVYEKVKDLVISRTVST